MSKSEKKEKEGRPFEREEFPVINPSFIPEPGYDNIDNLPSGGEYPSYQEPIPIDKPAEIGENGIKEF